MERLAERKPFPREASPGCPPPSAGSSYNPHALSAHQLHSTPCHTDGSLEGSPGSFLPQRTVHRTQI